MHIMKNFVLTVSVLALVSSCGAKLRQVNKLTEKDLKKIVSIEKDCPVENIKVLNKVRGAYHATYTLEVCGNKTIYRQKDGFGGFEELKQN